MVKNKVLKERTSVNLTPDRRDYMRSLGRKGDDYNDIMDSIRAIIEKYKVPLPITPPA